MKRILVISDLHYGHKFGLTPPQRFASTASQTAVLHRYQQEAWTAFTDLSWTKYPYDLCIANADLIEGKGTRTGGTELQEADLGEQARIAVECLKTIKAKRLLLTYGSPYHVGPDDNERNIAAEMDCEIHDHLFLNVAGWNFSVKHKISGSAIPHGRFTALAREALWNAHWAEQNGAPRCDTYIRSHVHYYAECGDSHTIARITPALQGYTKFGARQMSNTVDWGVLVFDVEPRPRGTGHSVQEYIRCHVKLARLASSRPGVVRL